MHKTKFIYQIEAEPHYNILVRILVRFARHRLRIEELQVGQSRESFQRISVIVNDTKESSLFISKKIEGEIDVLSVKLFEQTIFKINLCKTVLQMNCHYLSSR